MELKVIPIDKIKIAERQRVEYSDEKMSELIDSIVEHGLLNPITVEQVGEDEYLLLAGYHRLQAVMDLETYVFNGEKIPQGFIPAVVYEDLDEVKRAEIEFTENDARYELPWQERVRIRAMIHEMRNRQRGGTQTLSETAKEIDVSPATLSDDIFLAKHMDDPDIAKAKTKKEALKRLEKKLEREMRERLAEQVEVKDDHLQIIHGSAFDELPKIDGEFRCIITDPPYGVGADTFAYQGGSHKHDYEDTKEYAMQCYELVASEGARLVKNGFAFVFMFPGYFAEIAGIFTANGWDVWSTPLIWHKGSGTGFVASPRAPRRTYDAILYATRGDVSLATTLDDVISIRPSPERKAEKPAELYEKLLGACCVAGDQVIDPFAGAGPIFTAAKRLKLHAIGIEIDKMGVALCKEKIIE